MIYLTDKLCAGTVEGIVTDANQIGCVDESGNTTNVQSRIDSLASQMAEDISDCLKIENDNLIVGGGQTEYSNCALLGVGSVGYGDRVFGFGQGYIPAYLTGNGEGGNEGYIYNLWLSNKGSSTSHTTHNIVAEEFAKTHVGSFLLETGTFEKYAQFLKITYNGQDQPLIVEVDKDLGTLTDEKWNIENVGSGRTFSVGMYGNTGQYGIAMGIYSFNSSSSAVVIGSSNANGGQNSVLIGRWNKNTNTGQYSNVIGLQNTNSGQYANIVGRNNNNKCASTTIVGIANDIKETTYPSVVVGYNNSADTSTQQFTLGYTNHGTRGQYAPGNASCTWMIGHHLITSGGGFAIGAYNKDYDVQDTDKQNYFVIGFGEANQRSNSFELKANGDLYIQGVGGFDGTNSDSATVKTLQAKITDLENGIAVETKNVASALTINADKLTVISGAVGTSSITLQVPNDNKAHVWDIMMLTDSSVDITFAMSNGETILKPSGFSVASSKDVEISVIGVGNKYYLRYGEFTSE